MVKKIIEQKIVCPLSIQPDILFCVMDVRVEMHSTANNITDAILAR